MKRQLPLANWHPVHRVVVIIMAILLIWVAGSAIYTKINHSLVETVVIESETRDLKVQGYGYIYAETELIKVQHDGTYEPRAEQGERVAKKQLIADLLYTSDKNEKKYKKEYLAPIAGIVNYAIDGYESVDDPDTIEGLDLKSIYEDDKSKAKESFGKRDVTRGTVCAAVIDNLKPVVLYFSFSDKNNHVIKKADEVIRIRFPDTGDDVRAYVLSVDKDKNGKSWARLNLGPMSDMFLLERVVQAEAYKREQGVLKLDQATLVMKTGQSGRKIPGIYTLDNGMVKWQRVHVTHKTKNKVTCDILPKGTTIITTPERVREGEILK